MADDTKKEEKKDDKKGEHKGDAKPEAKASGKGPLLGIVIGALALAGVGAGVGMYVVKSLTPAKVEKPVPGAEPGDAHGDGHGGDAGGDGHGATGGDGKGLLANGMEIESIKLKGNVTGSGGTRYVTLTTSIWVPKTDQAKVNDPPVRRMIQAQLEKTMRTYQLEELQSPNIQLRMENDFGRDVERLLRELMPGRPPEQKFILRVDITELLTQ